MASIPYIGKCFPTAEQFLDYLDDIKFGAWRPSFVTMHHTGGPSLKTWEGYSRRLKPITDEQWMVNLASYYGNELKWSAGPHFFLTPKNFCVLSLPTKRGVHAVSFNALSWGVECVGDFDSEPFTSELADRYAEGLACLHIAAGLEPSDYKFNVRGLHFHRDDPRTTKTCPGKKVSKELMVRLISQKMAALSPGAHDDDDPVPPTNRVAKRGTVNVPKDDTLNVRDEPSGKSPVVGVLHAGEVISIIGEVKNGDTLWYKMSSGDYVAARYVAIA